jgi:hypothetical protein
MRAPSLRRSGFLATLAVGVGLLGSSLYGLAQVGHDLELATARPDARLVAERERFVPVADQDCPGRSAPGDGASQL